MNTQINGAIAPVSPNPSTREIQTAQALSEIKAPTFPWDNNTPPEWLPGLALGFQDPHLRQKFRQALHLIITMTQSEDGDIPEMPSWKGKAEAGPAAVSTTPHPGY